MPGPQAAFCSLQRRWLPISGRCLLHCYPVAASLALAQRSADQCCFNQRQRKQNCHLWLNYERAQSHVHLCQSESAHFGQGFSCQKSPRRELFWLFSHADSNRPVSSCITNKKQQASHINQVQVNQCVKNILHDFPVISSGFTSYSHSMVRSIIFRQKTSARPACL